MTQREQQLERALRGLFEHCAMIHKHWGENSNTKQAVRTVAYRRGGAAHDAAMSDMQ